MNEANEFIPTRQSLLSRLKDRDDQESWKVFFDTYWRLIYRAALRAGLTDAEAQDVVQETVLSVLKSMPGFEYDPAKGSFKSWLMRLTGWRITDQLRKRDRGLNRKTAPAGTSTRTATIERVPDPAGPGLEALWDKEWETNLLTAALERVKKKVDPKHYQIYDLHVVKKWPVSRVARTLKLNPGQIYLVKHRLNLLVKKEIASLQTRPF
jgi:RNA polymerase sigma factor (sigma-70 family)